MRLYTNSFYLPSRFWTTVFVLVLTFFLLTACGRGGDEAAGETPETAPPNAKTVCTEACRLQGQCGDNADGQPVVLGGTDQPTTHEPNQLFPQDASVNKLASQEKTVRRPETEIEETWQFFQVQMVDGGQTGWVAAICLVDQ